MNATHIRHAYLLLCWVGTLTYPLSDVLANDLPSLILVGDWEIRVTLPQSSLGEAKPTREISATLQVPPPTIVTVTAEKHAALPLYQAQGGAGWRRGVRLKGVIAQECTTRYLLDPDSLELRAGPERDSQLFELGKDYAADREWGSIGRLPDGHIGANQVVYTTYRHGMLRIDSVVLTAAGQIILRQGEPRAAAPRLAPLEKDDHRVANIWIPGRLPKLGPNHLFPILETAYPEAPKPSQSVAERFLPKTLKKLRDGQPLRILAWGDSVTVGSFVPDPDLQRWQVQFVDRLRERFPQAQIELVTEAWGGRNTARYLAEPPGSVHNYEEKVLGAKPDLVVSEFVNDAGLSPQAVEQRYSKLLADFEKIDAEWIILTPHYVRPDWMGLTRESDIDNDPRPYVAGLRKFAAKHSVALADASRRYGRLWRQGIPYSSLMLNSINHPDERGMKIFADSLMALFP